MQTPIRNSTIPSTHHINFLYSTPQSLTQSYTHTESTHTSAAIHLHVSLTRNILIWLPFKEESPVGRTWKAQTVILQRITPVWVPPRSSGSVAPSCGSRVTNVIETCYRHFYPGRHRTQLTSHYLIYPDSIHFALFWNQIKPETIGHFISKTKTPWKQSHFVPELHNLELW